MKLSHVDAAGRARMVDVADKPITVRTAVAEGSIRMSAEAYRLVADQAVAKGEVRVRSRARGVGRTVVEMEALTAVSVALLTVYDMVKAIDRGMELERVRLLEKTGGTHGDWRRAAGD